MAALTQKVQILLTDEQHQALLGLAKARGRPLSVLVRETVVEQLVAEARRVAKQKAFEEIISMALPVADWPEMEAQIERAHIESQAPQ
ncbi:MAG: hypothetical protein ETSY2_23530 [Candidatus Entotheonella gemina]|uniref:CopG family transcriptional regulator n=1 Tax=Candidatus Entotheonella gemina TaxID=1429439 RepID=W4M587_9BACT|nr:MAG: hypothetical protein ETSY2_23530 [Candidatus Entotheonella gemina]